jgi:hypothetical protein
LFATLQRHGETLPSIEVDTGSLRDDVLKLMRNSNKRITDLTAMLSGLIGTHFDDVEATPRELRAALFGSRANAVEEAIGRAVSRGEIGSGEIPARVVAVLYDLYRHEAIMSLASMQDEVIVEIVDQVWMPLIRSYADRTV